MKFTFIFYPVSLKMQLHINNNGRDIYIRATQVISYEEMACAWKELEAKIIPAVKNSDFFILLHSEDLEIYKDQLDVDSEGNYSLYGITFIGSRYAEKGKAQPLPIRFLEKTYFSSLNTFDAL